MAYAEKTRVAVSQTRNEIEAMLRQAKATRIVHMNEPTEAVVLFMLSGRLIKITVPLGSKIGDQERRAKWRQLGLVLKAKLEAVEQKITTAEQEFLAHVVLPDGKTVAQWVEPQLVVAFERGLRTRLRTAPLRRPRIYRSSSACRVHRPVDSGQRFLL